MLPSRRRRGGATGKGGLPPRDDPDDVEPVRERGRGTGDDDGLTGEHGRSTRSGKNQSKCWMNASMILDFIDVSIIPAL